jgi:hypothetical protein
VIILDEMDETDAFLAKLPEASERNFALVRRTLGKDGTFYTLCLPFDVPNIELSPLAGAEVFTFAGGTVTGHETGNEKLNLELVPHTVPRLQMGVPYLLRWTNTGERMTFLRFDGVENWVAEDVSEATSDPGNENIKFHGLYPRKRIPGYKAGDVPHYNFFVDTENTLWWPDDNLYKDSKMKGFRAYFQLSNEAVSANTFIIDCGNGEINDIRVVNGGYLPTDNFNVYDLQGRRVNEKLSRGIYIVNGKKMIVK